MDCLGLNNWLIRQCEVMGITKPTEIQENVIPKILEGCDVIGCAKTGSGKTAAFALPILHTLFEDPFGIFALVVTPTRELAFQIGEQIQVLGKPNNVKVTVITGGRDMQQQAIQLAQKPHVVVSTPGRLADHIRSGTNFSLKTLKYLVLDEADRLLEDEFGEQLTTIFENLPARRQTLLFSATLTDTLKKLQAISPNKPYTFLAKVTTVATLQQQYVTCPAEMKDAYLLRVLDTFLDKRPESAVIIFTHTCKMCQTLALMLPELGFRAVALHSLIPQRERLAALARFKSHQTRILIATDVASRGLDIPTVDLVINHNVPTKAKDYVHRVGRTARAGRGGRAVLLVTQFDLKLLTNVETYIDAKLEELKVSAKEAGKIFTEVAVARREAEMTLDDKEFGQKQEEYKEKRKRQLEADTADKGKKKQKSRAGSQSKLKQLS